MALFQKNWRQWVVSLGEPFLVQVLDRKFGGRMRDVFKIDEDGSVLVGGRELLGNPVFSYAGTAGAPIVNIQIKDAAGNNIAQRNRCSVWVSATAGGTPIGTDTTGLTTSVSTGTLALTKLANLDLDVITTAGGALGLTLTDAAGATTRFVNIQIGDKTYSSKAIISPP